MRSRSNPAHEVTISRESVLPLSITDEQIESLVAFVLEAEGVEIPWQVGIQLIDDAAMQAAHAQYMDIDTPTDIMTFPYEEDDFEVETIDDWPLAQGGGDLMISVERATANAVDTGWGPDREVLFLIVHGLLHLLGWDDHTDEDRHAMLSHQETLLTQWSDEFPGAMPAVH